MSQPYRRPTHHYQIPPAFYPHVTGQPDERAAFEAYSSWNDLLDYRARQMPNEPYCGEVIYRTKTAHLQTFDQTRRSVLSVAKAHVDSGLVKPRASLQEKPVIVTILASSCVDIWINVLALQRIGAIPCLVSAMLAPVAVAHIIREAGTSLLLIGPGGDETARVLPADLSSLPRMPWQSRHDAHHQPIQSASPGDVEQLSLQVTNGLSKAERYEEVGFILHTTGTTALPKVVPQIIKATMAMHAFYFCKNNLHLSSLNHIGSYVGAGCSLARGVAWINATPFPLTWDVVSTLVNLLPVSAESLWGPALVLQLLAQHADGRQFLSRFETCGVIGGDTPAHVMQALTEMGMGMWMVFGSTEGGLIAYNNNSEHPPLEEHEWISALPPELGGEYTEFRRYDGEQEAYELFLREGWTALQVCNRPDGYATGDLFLRHHTQRHKYRYWKRIDDVLEHNSGWKTDPSTIENAFNASPLVHASIAVGTGWPSVAVLVIPEGPDTTVESLQPVIDQLNSVLTAHSRIRADMIAILDPSEQVVRSIKGSLVRRLTLDKFKDTIDRLYAQDTVETGH